MNPDPEINQIYLEIESVFEGKYFSLIAYQFEGFVPDELDYKYDDLARDPNHTGLLSSFRLIGSKELGMDVSGLLIGGQITLNTVAQTANWLRALNRTTPTEKPWLHRLRRWLTNERPHAFAESVTYFKVVEEQGTRLPIIESFRCINNRSLHFQDLRHGHLVELSADIASTLIDPTQLAEHLLTASALIQIDKTSRFTPDYRDANEVCDFALRIILRRVLGRCDKFSMIDRHDPSPSFPGLENTTSRVLGYLRSDDDTGCIAFLSNSLMWSNGHAFEQLAYDQVVTSGFHRWDKLGSKVPLCAGLHLDCVGFSIEPHEILPLLERLKGARNAAISRHTTTEAKPINSHDHYANCIPPRVSMRMR